MIGRNAALPLHLTSATLLRVSAEGVATALVLTVQARTGNAATAGYLQTAMTLPYVLSGPVIGHALDRVGRPRRVAVALAAGYAAGDRAAAGDGGTVTARTRFLVAAVIGCTEPIVVALTNLLPRFVPPGRLSRAYGLEASSYNGGHRGPRPGRRAGLPGGGGQYAGAAIVAAAVAGVLALPLLPLPARPASARGPDAGRPPGRGHGHAAVPVTAASANPGTDPGATADADPGARRGVLSVVAGGLVVLAEGRVLRALTAATTLAWMGFGGVAVTAVLLAEHIGAEPSAVGRCSSPSRSAR